MLTPDDFEYLAQAAAGLDLRHPEGNTAFRTRLAVHPRAMRVDALREWVPAAPFNDRAATVRAVADACLAEWLVR